MSRMVTRTAAAWIRSRGSDIATSIRGSLPTSLIAQTARRHQGESAVGMGPLPSGRAIGGEGIFRTHGLFRTGAFTDVQAAARTPPTFKEGRCVLLVFSRKLRESFRVGESTITVLRTGSTVRLGIEAPPHVPVVRCELPPLSLEPTKEEPDVESPEQRAA